MAVSIFRYDIMSVAKDEEIKKWINLYGDMVEEANSYRFQHADSCERFR